MFLRSFSQIRTGTITLSETAQPLALPATLERDRDAGRIALEIVNVDDENACYVGDSTVTSSTGIPIKAGESRIFPVLIGSGDKIYGVGDGDVVVAEYF